MRVPWGRSPGVGNGSQLHYSCLENPMDRGAWWVTVHSWQRVKLDYACIPHNLQRANLGIYATVGLCAKF